MLSLWFKAVMISMNKGSNGEDAGNNSVIVHNFSVV